MSNEKLGPLYPSGRGGPLGQQLLMNERLWHTAKQLEKLNSNITSLNNSITKFNTEASKQTDKLIYLTCVIVGLTLLMLIGLGIQIWLASVK